jgi:hypothetical protein
MKYGTIKRIEEVKNCGVGNWTAPNGKNGSQLGMKGMISVLFGERMMDGYLVETNTHKILVLIDNGQSCCESWGYIQSEDDLAPYVGARLKEIKLTNTACNEVMLKQECLEYGFERGGIQFVDFITDKGTFQLAVYNSHNGYYGHGIMVAVDEKIIHQDTI